MCSELFKIFNSGVVEFHPSEFHLADLIIHGNQRGATY